MVKNLPADAGDARDMGSTRGQENPLEKEMTTRSSILAWKIPQRDLVGCNTCSCKRFDTAEQLRTHMDSKMERSARNVHRYSGYQFKCMGSNPSFITY